MINNALKTYLEDYAEAYNVSAKFYAKHWKGNLILIVAAGTIPVLTMKISDAIKKKKKEHRNNEESEN